MLEEIVAVVKFILQVKKVMLMCLVQIKMAKLLK